jgi:hypothetical protein
MSPLILKHLFLFALLVADWVWDTHFGKDFFSQPMSSSHATLARPSSDDDHPERHDPDRTAHLGLVPFELGLLLPELSLTSLQATFLPLPLPDLLYMFMTLRL